MKAEIVKTIDANTGEHVSKCAMTQDYKDEMVKVLNAHQHKLNMFMMMSQQVADLQIKWFELRKQLDATDESFKSKMKYIAKKLKLAEHEPWAFNMQEQCFELREPPEIKPLTAGQLHGELDGPK